MHRILCENKGKLIACINLRGRELQDKDTKELAILIKTNFKRIEVIDLGDNYLTTRSLKYFLKHLQDINVYEILMDKNNLDVKAINYLLSFTKYNSSMQKFTYGRVNPKDITSKINKALNVLKKKGLAVQFTNE